MPRAHWRGPRGGGALRSAAPRARPATAGGGGRRVAKHRGRDPLSRDLPLLHGTGGSRRARGTEPAMARRAASDGRRGECQQRCRCHQLRDARVRAAPARLRPVWDPRRTDRRAAGGRGGALHRDQSQGLHAHRADVRDRRCGAAGGARRCDGRCRYRDRPRYDRCAHRIGPVRSATRAGSCPWPGARESFVLPVRAWPRSCDGRLGQPPGRGACARTGWRPA